MNRSDVRAGKRRADQRAFAYLWVLLCVALLGLGLGVAVEWVSTAVQREKEEELLSIGQQFRAAIGRYYEAQATAGRREYPATLDELLLDPRLPGVRRHLRRVFIDPMTGKAEWGLILVGGRIAGVHSLSARPPIKQDRFEPGDMGFAGKATYTEWRFTYPADLQLKREQGGFNDGPGEAMRLRETSPRPYRHSRLPCQDDVQPRRCAARPG